MIIKLLRQQRICKFKPLTAKWDRSIWGKAKQLSYSIESLYNSSKTAEINKNKQMKQLTITSR
jgi:hypothetical protein